MLQLSADLAHPNIQIGFFEIPLGEGDYQSLLLGLELWPPLLWPLQISVLIVTPTALDDRFPPGVSSSILARSSPNCRESTGALTIRCPSAGQGSLRSALVSR